MAKKTTTVAVKTAPKNISVSKTRAPRKARVSDTEETTASVKFDLREHSQAHGATRAATTSAHQYLTGYDTADANVYIAKLERMESTELYDHAVAVGEVPIDDRNRLVDRLHVRFLQTQAAAIPRQNIPINMSPENEAILRKIMAPAR